MARPAAVKPENNKPLTSNNEILIPAPTERRAELFFLLGALQGKVSFATRLTELVIAETSAPAPPTEG